MAQPNIASIFRAETVTVTSVPTANIASLFLCEVRLFSCEHSGSDLELLHCDYTNMSLDAIFIRFHRILSLRNKSPTADYIQDIVYKRREHLFETQYDGNKVKGREKTLIKKVTVVKLLNKTSFYGAPPPNANLFLFTNCTAYRNNDHLQGKASLGRKFIVQTCQRNYL
jgi:hypothetical protein